MLCKQRARDSTEVDREAPQIEPASTQRQDESIVEHQPSSGDTAEPMDATESTPEAPAHIDDNR